MERHSDWGLMKPDDLGGIDSSSLMRVMMMLSVLMNDDKEIQDYNTTFISSVSASPESSRVSLNPVIGSLVLRMVWISSRVR